MRPDDGRLSDMSDRPPVTVRDDTDQQRYEAVVGGQVAGFIQYRLDGDVVDMVHTEVDDRWEGKGVASALAEGALAEVRAAGRTVVPSCPFVKGYIEKHEEHADLVG